MNTMSDYITTKPDARRKSENRGRLVDDSYIKGTFIKKGAASKKRTLRGRNGMGYLVFPDGTEWSEIDIQMLARTDPESAANVLYNHHKAWVDERARRKGREMTRVRRKVRRKARKLLAAA